MNERIKAIRKMLAMTGAEFGSRIGLTNASISRIESGVTVTTEQTIRSICREFGVNEVWLRTGEGEPFLYTSREAELGALVRSRLVNRPESFQRALITVLLRFDPEGPEWSIIERIYDNLAAELPDRPDVPAPPLGSLAEGAGSADGAD